MDAHGSGAGTYGMLDNKNSLQDSEVEKLEAELNNVIIELARMK